MSRGPSYAYDTLSRLAGPGGADDSTVISYCHLSLGRPQAWVSSSLSQATMRMSLIFCTDSLSFASSLWKRQAHSQSETMQGRVEDLQGGVPVPVPPQPLLRSPGLPTTPQAPQEAARKQPACGIPSNCEWVLGQHRMPCCGATDLTERSLSAQRRLLVSPPSGPVFPATSHRDSRESCANQSSISWLSETLSPAEGRYCLGCARWVQKGPHALILPRAPPGSTELGTSTCGCPTLPRSCKATCDHSLSSYKQIL